MSSSKAPRPCSIADALALVGEKYSLLVLREVCLGNGRFDQLVRNIGAPRDVLAARLKRLVEVGVLEKSVYSTKPLRHEYRPTRSGLDLAPVLLVLKEWGDRHLNPGAPPMVLEHACGHEFVSRIVCSKCADEVRHGDLAAHPQVPGWTVAGPTAAP